jgi:hypothetical protein
MEREARRDRRARFDLEPLEGRELMSAGSLPGIKPGDLEHRQLHAVDARPSNIHSIPEPVHLSGDHPLRALARVTKPARSAITAVVAAGPDANGSVTITGQTYRRAKVSLDIQADGTIEQTVRANAGGEFQLTLTVGFGNTPIRLSETARGHRPTSTTLTVNRPQPTAPPPPTSPQPPANLPVGDFRYIYSQYAGEIVTDDLTLSFALDGSGQLHYAIETFEDPYSPDNPFNPNPVELDLWVANGRWEANGTGAEFIGQCTYTRTNNADPSLNTKEIFNVAWVFPYLELNQGLLDVTLPADFGKPLGPNGPTQNLALSRI